MDRWEEVEEKIHLVNPEGYIKILILFGVDKKPLEKL